MEEDYSRFTPQERLTRICEILVRGIYRAEVLRRAEIAGEFPEKNKQIYGLAKAAQQIGISKRTLQRWISKGILMPEKNAAGAYVISEEKIREYRNRKHDQMCAGITSTRRHASVPKGGMTVA